jgi:hypothetical protein
MHLLTLALWQVSRCTENADWQPPISKLFRDLTTVPHPFKSGQLYRNRFILTFVAGQNRPNSADLSHNRDLTESAPGSDSEVVEL